MTFTWSETISANSLTHVIEAQDINEMRDNADWLHDNLACVSHDSADNAVHNSGDNGSNNSGENSVDFAIDDSSNNSTHNSAECTSRNGSDDSSAGCSLNWSTFRGTYYSNRRQTIYFSNAANSTDRSYHNNSFGT